MDHRIMLNNVKVNTKDLLVKLEENREKHRKDLIEAKKNYLIAAKELLTKKLEKLNNGLVEDLKFNVSPPDDHTEEYDLIISMLKMSTEETMYVTYQQFEAFVNDRWQWKQEFLVKNSTYLSSF